MTLPKKLTENKKIIKIISIVLAVAVVIGIGVAIFSPKNPGKKKNLSGYVVGYLPYYSSAAADRIDFSALTHLNVAFANPNDNGVLYLE